MRYRKPKSRYTARAGRQPPPESPEDLDELKRLTGGYTPIRPPVPRREEPRYDTRYQPSNEEPHDRVGGAYRGEPDPNYEADDYDETPAPQPPTPEQRFTRPPRDPRERIPNYDDGRMTDELFERLMRESQESRTGTDPFSPAEPPDDGGSPDAAESLDDLSGGPPDQPAPDDLTAAFGTPPPESAGSPMPGEPQPWPEPRPPEDPTALANRAFDEQMRDAFSPQLPVADLETRTDALFDEQMRQAFAPPPPDPFADPFPDPIRLEQQLFDQQMPMNDPFPDPGPPMM